MKACHSLPCILLVILFSAATDMPAADSTTFTQPLPTGVKLDAVGDAIDLGSMPLAMTVAPGGDRLAVVLSGWREQGVQIVDLKSRQVVQTLVQPAAFFGVGFSRDGKELFVSGGNDDSIFCYSWRDGTAAFERKIILSEKLYEAWFPLSRRPRCLANRKLSLCSREHGRQPGGG